MNNNELLAGTKDEQRTAADSSTSASVEANPMLSAALSVEEGNKLIAEFMGFRKLTKKESQGLQMPWMLISKDGEFFSFSQLEYHSSWDLLMPVVEKISQIEYDRYEQENGFEKYIEIETAFPRTFGMINSRTGNPMFRFNRCQCFEAPSLREVTWLAVVDFLNGNVASVGSR